MTRINIGSKLALYPNYAKISPILFEMPSYTYLGTGAEIGKCMKMH